MYGVDEAMVMKIWFHPESPYARRVLCFLDWTGITAERIPLALENREHRDESYLKINPFARVPAIVDNGFALSESLAILRYLVARDGLWNWYPQDLRGRAVADQWLEYVSQHASRPFIDLAWSRQMAARFGHKAQDGVEVAALKKMKRELPVLEARLRASPFLAGDHPTLADVALYPFATLAGEAGLDLHADAPHVAVWIGQMAALTVISASAVNQP